MSKRDYELMHAAQALDQLLSYIDTHAFQQKSLNSLIKENTFFDNCNTTLADEETLWFDDEPNRDDWFN